MITTRYWLLLLLDPHPILLFQPLLQSPFQCAQTPEEELQLFTPLPPGSTADLTATGTMCEAGTGPK